MGTASYYSFYKKVKKRISELVSLSNGAGNTSTSSTTSAASTAVKRMEFKFEGLPDSFTSFNPIFNTFNFQSGSNYHAATSTPHSRRHRRSLSAGDAEALDQLFSPVSRDQTLDSLEYSHDTSSSFRIGKDKNDNSDNDDNKKSDSIDDDIDAIYDIDRVIPEVVDTADTAESGNAESNKQSNTKDTEDNNNNNNNNKTGAVSVYGDYLVNELVDNQVSVLFAVKEGTNAVVEVKNMGKDEFESVVASGKANSDSNETFIIQGKEKYRFKLGQKNPCKHVLTDWYPDKEGYEYVYRGTNWIDACAVGKVYRGRVSSFPATGRGDCQIFESFGEVYIFVGPPSKGNRDNDGDKPSDVFKDLLSKENKENA
jgi:hypothetical protein